MSEAAPFAPHPLIDNGAKTGRGSLEGPPSWRSGGPSRHCRCVRLGMWLWLGIDQRDVPNRTKIPIEALACGREGPVEAIKRVIECPVDGKGQLAKYGEPHRRPNAQNVQQEECSGPQDQARNPSTLGGDRVELEVGPRLVVGRIVHQVKLPHGRGI